MAGLTAIVNLAVPQLEAVGKARSVSMSPSDAPSIEAIRHVARCSRSSTPIMP
ncbi:putative membrane mmpL2 domain protein [Mycobacterium kansasii]|uniref:Putative membrane mmpL2 domain protein n=1 Tax=Mycobacterium kansasii TaxID=1768 RepID=A0A1V3WB49_MYCKA|nr:putative membrane mmpL2 domain protein [Mycobacterium kansasii]